MFVLVPVTCIWCFTPVNLHHQQVSSADVPLLGDWCWLRSFEWPLFQVFPHFPWSIHHPRSDNWDSFHFHGFWMCIHSHLTFYLRLHNILVEICIILISSSETQATTKDFVSCFQCYSLQTLKPQCDQLGPISHHNAEMWQKSKTNVPRSRPVETHKTEVNCDIQLRRYWSQMTGSGHITVFIFLFFPLILTTYEGADGVEACSGIYTRREGTRWTDEGRRACPEDRLAEWIETESDRNRREREPMKGFTVKGRAEKARAESENPAKKQDMDQSQGKSKAHSLWKHSERGILSLNISPQLLYR